MPTESVEKLYLFPRYQGREEYRRALGIEPPPFAPTKPIKRWFDPMARNSPRRAVVYDFAFVLSPAGNVVVGPEGAPLVDVLVLSKDEAGTVNLPPAGGGLPDETLPEVPCPMRALLPGERLVMTLLGPVLQVGPQEDKGLFTEQDRALLRAIADAILGKR